MIDKELLEILACPSCKGDIELIKNKENKERLRCKSCRLCYPIRDGIPIMLIDEATKEE